MTSLPRVSLFVFCYQQADFIEQAIIAALAQDYGNLQIIISDDASSDDTYSIAQAVVAQYRGNHQITLNRNSQNLGIGRHFIHIMENLVQGELVVASAGDDISAPNRVSRIVEQWLANGKPAVVAHCLEEIDEQGRVFVGSRSVQYRVQDYPDKWPKAMALLDYLQSPFPLPFIGAALAYRRDIYQFFGTPMAEPAYEDHLMYFRALLSGGLHYFPEVLVKYRRHRNNFTAKSTQPNLKTLHIPGLYQGILQNPTVFEPYGLGVFRLHQLTTQQWLDYRKAVQAGKTAVDLTVVSALWEQLIWRHSRLLKLKGRIAARLCLLRYAASQVISALRYRFGHTQYHYQDNLLTADYAPPLRTIVFGAGSGGEKALANLNGGFHIIAVCDNNAGLHGSRFCGLPVISPLQLKEDIENIDCVVIASTYFHEIKAKLTDELAIPAGKIGWASYVCITRPFLTGVTAAVTTALVTTAVLLLLALAGLLLF